ncbi:unnamed protein product [Lactuca saligna]|uniref:Uncharacterized protein n=1 Tax=Lactuca saligna TaxID=75948 RepID=A0AA35ZGF8_LACSI|nr:unnamed protein product [Lactuca saligna]
MFIRISITTMRYVQWLPLFHFQDLKIYCILSFLIRPDVYVVFVFPLVGSSVEDRTLFLVHVRRYASLILFRSNYALTMFLVPKGYENQHLEKTASPSISSLPLKINHLVVYFLILWCFFF